MQIQIDQKQSPKYGSKIFPKNKTATKTTETQT